jgi:hypothetical protein
MQLNLFRWFAPILLLLTSCATPPPPSQMNNICQIFKQYPAWYNNTYEVEKKFGVPIAVQMAIIHQESHFNGEAKPPRKKLLFVIPWSRPSTAYGYSQALDGTWALYKNAQGRFWASRTNFYDAVHFVGWYSHVAHLRTGMSKKNAYTLYLAYHEGVTGYQRKTYLKKTWLMHVARKVQSRASIYQAQLRHCQR